MLDPNQKQIPIMLLVASEDPRVREAHQELAATQAQTFRTVFTAKLQGIDNLNLKSGKREPEPSIKRIVGPGTPTPGRSGAGDSIVHSGPRSEC